MKLAVTSRETLCCASLASGFVWWDEAYLHYAGKIWLFVKLPHCMPHCMPLVFPEGTDKKESLKEFCKMSGD